VVHKPNDEIHAPPRMMLQEREERATEGARREELEVAMRPQPEQKL
jgi:hypothetical protein